MMWFTTGDTVSLSLKSFQESIETCTMRNWKSYKLILWLCTETYYKVKNALENDGGVQRQGGSLNIRTYAYGVNLRTKIKFFTYFLLK